jgi:hypothetical protein
MSPQVGAVLEQIERLNKADRTLLERILPELSDAAWNREAEIARATARQRGANQKSIDDAVNDLRYGA